MLDLKDILNLTPLLFIVNISILTNFIGDTLGNKIQTLFTENIILKHIIVILLIYTTITVVDNKVDPYNRFKKTLYIWMLYLLLTKNILRITLILVLLMIVLFILEDYINYYKNTNKNLEKKLTKISNFLKYLILILLIIGHIMYINKQKNIFNNDFNLYELYLGNKH